MRQIADDKAHIRVTNLIFPNAFIIPMSREMTISQWHVPIDDVKHYWYAIFTSFGAPVNKDEMRRQRLELYELPDYVPRKNKNNDYGFDPHEQEHTTYTGMGADINVHDQWACESMGAIQDRTEEHLGTSDKAISAYRRLLRQALDQSGKGERPMMVLDDASRQDHHRPGLRRRHRSGRRLAGLLAANRRGAAIDQELDERALRLEWPGVRAAKDFVERHGLWNAGQTRAAKAVVQQIKKQKLELVRFAFADQHGVLRGKTVVAADAPALMRSGVTMTTTLLAKDTAHKTAFPVFTPGGGFGMEEMQGAADFVMVPDPATFHVLPWAPNTGWLLCDIVFTNGKPVPFSTRQVLRDALAKLKAAGFDYLAGLEVEFHLFKIENPRLAPEDATWPPRAPEVSLLNQGYQYLTESRFDQIESALEPIRRGIQALGLPLRSLEVELGPSQCEFTFRPQRGLAAADTMILFRAATKQIARRHGLLASFMCRPAQPNLFSIGLASASVLDRQKGRQCFRRQRARRACPRSA